MNSKILEKHTGPAFKQNEWVLMQNPKPTKLVPKWTGPYKILKAHWLGTYALQTPEGRVLRHLMHGNRLVKANCNSATAFWNRPNPLAEKLQVKPTSPEVLQALDGEDDAVPNVKTWSTLSEAEWRRLQNFAPGSDYRAGARRFLVGEREKKDQDGQISQHVELARRRKTNMRSSSHEDVQTTLAWKPIQEALEKADERHEEHQELVLQKRLDDGVKLQQEFARRSQLKTAATEPSQEDLTDLNAKSPYSLRKNRTATKKFRT